MNECSILFSLSSQNSLGRCYHKSKRASMFLSNIWQDSDTIEVFVLNFLDTLHHELLHLLMKEWKIRGCYSEKKVDFGAKHLSNKTPSDILVAFKELFVDLPFDLDFIIDHKAWETWRVEHDPEVAPEAFDRWRQGLPKELCKE